MACAYSPECIAIREKESSSESIQTDDSKVSRF
jgi:hypothetical protein